jgi:hypothetical protein
MSQKAQIKIGYEVAKKSSIKGDVRIIKVNIAVFDTAIIVAVRTCGDAI